eukprot:CAMPEP_0197895014 /NCGR_PEP_ID=MMETSP1439-20131203/36216_1 /TAXON_ID=66791 /ORGANISM="Gonyaulax spinifera, Strain CCMP409" /LENGTH=65 /DNA_ID=CAMNT_0043515409 /DNA_START=17 /DNA_END=211 /DNA_ORIENTATION=+
MTVILHSCSGGRVTLGSTTPAAPPAPSWPGPRLLLLREEESKPSLFRREAPLSRAAARTASAPGP